MTIALEGMQRPGPGGRNNDIVEWSNSLCNEEQELPQGVRGRILMCKKRGAIKSKTAFYQACGRGGYGSWKGEN